MHTNQSDRYHVVGVAGVGMSAVAQALLDQGFPVSGSDRFLDQGEQLEVLNRLVAAGVKLAAQDGSAVTRDTKRVVVSTAIEKDNPDLAAAARQGVRVSHRAAMLAELAQGRQCIAITGTSGKTTVTGMVGWILERAGLDPTVICGGVVLDWQSPSRVGNVRKGTGRHWVVEADESDKSLLNFFPQDAVITNVSKDHFELDEVIDLFRAFHAQVRGKVIGGPGVAACLGLPAIESEPFQPILKDGKWQFALDGAVFRIPVRGRHNAENAFVAARLCRHLGVALPDIVRALEAFRGIHRRLEQVGESRGISVIDDYAHNPAKIAASWRAVAESSPRILAFWRPHGFGPLLLMKGELADTFAEVMRPGDQLFVLPVFYAGGTAQKGYSSSEFVQELQARGIAASPVAGYPELEPALLREARAGDVILGMGARDPELQRFGRRLVEGLAHG